MPADTFSTDGIGVLFMGTGNDNNTWGTNQNTSVFGVLVDAITNALTSAVTGGTLDLSGSPPPAASSQVHYAGLIFTGTLLSSQTIQVPNLNKWWLVANNTAGAFTLKFKTPSGSASTAIPQNSGWQLVQCDGTNNIVVWPFNTKQVQMPDGSVSAPAYSHVNEPTTGWYRAGTNDYRLAIGGVDVLQVTGAGAGSPNILNAIAQILLTSIGISTAAADTAPAVGDLLPIYQLSSTTNKRISLSDFFKVIDALTAKTTLAAADEVAIYDVAGVASKKASLTNLFAAIDALTAKTSPVAADEVAIYDVAGATSKKSTLAQVRAALPAFTTQYLTSGTGAIYTTPANCRVIRVRYVAGGGGGYDGGSPGTGGTTTFNSVDAVGGGPGGVAGATNGGIGGTGGAGAATFRMRGAPGDNGEGSGGSGGHGGGGLFGLGGGQAATNAGGTSTAGATNSGAGGGGKSAGGGGGEYVELMITNPAATYTYTIGAGGAAGTGSSAAGGSGVIIVEEFY